MLDSAVTRFTLPVLAAALMLGCYGADEKAAMVPLGQAGTAGTSPDGAPVPTITGEAKLALDSANLLFRAKSYDLALAQYRRSSQLAPAEVAPLLGVLMVAEVKKDSKLVESTLSRIRELDPSAVDSTATPGHAEIIDLHSRVRPNPPSSP